MGAGACLEATCTEANSVETCVLGACVGVRARVETGAPGAEACGEACGVEGKTWRCARWKLAACVGTCAPGAGVVARGEACGILGTNSVETCVLARVGTCAPGACVGGGGGDSVETCVLGVAWGWGHAWGLARRHVASVETCALEACAAEVEAGPDVSAAATVEAWFAARHLMHSPAWIVKQSRGSPALHRTATSWCIVGKLTFIKSHTICANLSLL